MSQEMIEALYDLAKRRASDLAKRRASNEGYPYQQMAI